MKINSKTGKKRPPPETTREPSVYTDDEVSRLVQAIPTRSVMGLRNRALLMVYYRSGIRCAEGLALRPHDLDREHHTVRVTHGKGGKFRVVGMDDGAFEFVDRWIDARARLRVTASSPLFCSRNGKALPTSYVRKMLVRLGEKTKIEKRVHCHGFRHTMASEMLRSGEPLSVISHQLGHERLSTTDTYLQKIEPSDVIRAMSRRKLDPAKFSPDGVGKKNRKGRR